MALSNSFFGLRRGSTKSLTFQRYNGRQVTKDRVYDVKNPQSDAQMKQRLKLPLIANAASVLKDIINHSFEGVEEGQESINEFRRANLKSGYLDPTIYVPKGAMNMGLANFIVAKGTLQNQSPEQVTANTITMRTLTADLDNNYNDQREDKQPTYEELLKFREALMGADNPDQITILVCYHGGNYAWKDADGTEHNQPIVKYMVSRLIFAEGRQDENAGWEVRNTNEIGNGYMCITIENTVAKITLDGNFAAYDIYGAAIIESKYENGFWRRSFATIEKSSSAPTVGYDVVLPSYLDDDHRKNTSQYLNTGDETVGVTGGDA